MEPPSPFVSRGLGLPFFLVLVFLFCLIRKLFQAFCHICQSLHDLCSRVLGRRVLHVVLVVRDRCGLLPRGMGICFGLDQCFPCLRNILLLCGFLLLEVFRVLAETLQRCRKEGSPLCHEVGCCQKGFVKGISCFAKYFDSRVQRLGLDLCRLWLLLQRNSVVPVSKFLDWHVQHAGDLLQLLLRRRQSLRGC